jgi:hypothetical protein
MHRRSFCNQASVHPCGVEPSGNASRCRGFWAKDLTKRAANRRALHRLGPLKSTSVVKCALRGAKGVNKSLQKSVAAEKTNNFHVGLDFFSGVFCCVAHQRGSAADCGGYHQPKFLEWCLARLDGAGRDTPWYIVLGPHDAPAPVEVAKHC